MKRTGCRPFYWERQHGVPDCSTKEQLLLIGTLNTLLDHSSSTPGLYHLPFALCPFGVPYLFKSVPGPQKVLIKMYRPSKISIS